jgi:hypothetical protein
MWFAMFLRHVKFHPDENDDDRVTMQTLPRSCGQDMERVRQKGSEHLFQGLLDLELGKKIHQ